MDKLAKYNKSRWEALAQAGVEYSRPYHNLTPQTAQEYLADRLSFSPQKLGDVTGKDVLCLASGGGQQTAVFGILGANVTVLDLSDTQLARDRETAVHYGYHLTSHQGDMRDLSRFTDDSFDIIWHPYSINFVPDAAPVIRQVSRVVRPGGFYYLQFSNPFWSMDEDDWMPQGYPLKQPYVNGTQLRFSDPHWEFEDEQGKSQRIEGPHEFLHTWSAIVNALAQSGFVILGLREWPAGDNQAEPGSWEHMNSILPPFVTIGAVYRPEVFTV